jgi:ribosomal protein S18 acetylase RimI-like enzyme
MIIRKAKDSDLESIATIHIESWQNSYTNVLPPEFLGTKIEPLLKEHSENITISDDDVVLIAIEDEKIIRFIAVWCRPTPFIDNLHVKSSHRSRNVGTTLLKVAAETLIEKDKKNVYLWVFHSNNKAIKLYKKLGGIQRESAIKNIFEHDVLSTKIEWPDLSIIST